MKKGKFIMAAFALLALLFIGGTVAYFTDTDSATNTFTLGNVDIELIEPNWDSTGAAAAAQNILPGAVIAKDPKVQNVGTSDAYVFIKVKEPCYATTKAFTYTVNSGWVVVGTAGACSGTGVNTIETVYAYGGSNMTTLVSNTTTTALFDNVTLNTALDNAAVTALSGATDNQGKQIVVTAYAIQKDNLSDTTPSGVWANF